MTPSSSRPTVTVAPLSSLLTSAKSYADEQGWVITSTMHGGDLVNNTNAGSLLSVNSEFKSVLTNLTDADIFYTYGSHDAGITVEEGTNGYLVGAVDRGSFYYYGISYDGMTSAATATTEIAAFNTFVASADSSKPIIIMSHVPMHARRNDNNGASQWLSAINAAADKFDIVFFWGHNHTGETSVDTACYYVPVGGSITAQGDSSATTLGFTYANAGFINNGYASVVHVAPNTITIQRVSTSGTSNNYVITRGQQATEPAETEPATETTRSIPRSPP